MSDVKQSIDSIVAKHVGVPLVNTPMDIVEVGELLNERTETAKVFDAGKGRRTAHIFACPIHFKDIDGKWKSIDPMVKRKPLADARQTHKYETKSGLYHAHFKKDKPWDYRLEVGDSWVEYEAQFAESESLTIDVQTSRIGVKETITLLDKNASTKLSWLVTRSGTGIITSPPTATDANGKNIPVKVTQDKGVLTYDVDIINAVFPITIDPTSVITTNSGYLNSSHATTYETARDVTTAGTVYLNNFIWIGQYVASYHVQRTFLSFVIPNMSALSATSLFLNGRNDGSDYNFDVYIHTSTYSNPLVVADFDQFAGWQESGVYNGTILNNTWNASSYLYEWNEFVFNASGLAAVLAKKNDTFKMVAISGEDYNNSTPSGSEYVNFRGVETAGEEPYLSITFTPPVSYSHAIKSSFQTIGRGITTF